MTAGTGHRRAAEALAEAAQRAYPDAEVTCLDFLQFAPRWFRHGYGWTYLFLVRHLSWIWEISYHLLDTSFIYCWFRFARRLWNLQIVRRARPWLRAHRPDVIVTTHFLPADVCSAGKRAGWLHASLVVVVTDLHPHWFWLSQEADAVVVATSQSAQVSRARGIDAARIHVLGIPIAPAFSAPYDLTTLRVTFGLDEHRRTILITSGGTTVGQFERVVEAVIDLELAFPGRLQLLVVCGEDESARIRLTQLARHSPMPLRPFGFVDYMAELMAAADLIVTKAGGLTVSEALGRGKPLVLYHIIPGQEQLNARYVQEHGAGMIAPRPMDVAAAIRRCVEHPQELKRMHEAAKRLSYPHAATDIIDHVVTPLLSR